MGVVLFIIGDRPSWEEKAKEEWGEKTEKEDLSWALVVSFPLVMI